MPKPSLHEQHLADATCLACSCMCDDIGVTVAGGQVTEVRHACAIGQAWFRQQEDRTRPVCRVHGQEVPLETGLGAAAELLLAAKNPLIYGFGETTCEAQQRAVAIADWIGGTIDTATSFGHAPSIMAFQNVGKVTATLGEIGNRSDLVIFWGANPASNQPRLLSKYTLDRPGMFVPEGRAGRKCVVIDIQPTATSAVADQFLQIKPHSDFEVLTTLRMLLHGIEPAAQQVEQATAVPLEIWRAFVAQLKTARYGAFLFGMGLMRTGGRHNNCELLLRLTRELNDHTRFVCRSVRQRGNVTGADKVVTWQTGYPFCVNLSRGYPRYNPGEYTTATALARREVDVALIVGNDPMPDFTDASRAHLQAIPYITLSTDETPITRAAAVSFTTSRFGVAGGGTVYRMDEVPLQLRPALSSVFPSDAEVLTRLETLITARRQVTQMSGQ